MELSLWGIVVVERWSRIYSLTFKYLLFECLHNGQLQYFAIRMEIDLHTNKSHIFNHFLYPPIVHRDILHALSFSFVWFSWFDTFVVAYAICFTNYISMLDGYLLDFWIIDEFWKRNFGVVMELPHSIQSK